MLLTNKTYHHLHNRENYHQILNCKEKHTTKINKQKTSLFLFNCHTCLTTVKDTWRLKRIPSIRKRRKMLMLGFRQLMLLKCNTSTSRCDLCFCSGSMNPSLVHTKHSDGVLGEGFKITQEPCLLLSDISHLSRITTYIFVNNHIHSWACSGVKTSDIKIQALSTSTTYSIYYYNTKTYICFLTN